VDGVHVVLVGMNPGEPLDDERAAVRGATDTSNAAVSAALYSFFETHVLLTRTFYTRTRNALRALGFDGTILWTESVKCSSLASDSLSVLRTPETFRACGTRWLQRETALVPPEWPVVALGQDAFASCVLMLARRVLGIPHPTAGRSTAFWRVFHADGGRLHVAAKLQPSLSRWRDGSLPNLMLRIEPSETQTSGSAAGSKDA
jgi:hypothetical protein